MQNQELDRGSVMRGLYALCLSNVPIMVYIVSKYPKVTVDSYTTSLHLVSDTHTNGTSIFREHPVDVDMKFDMNISQAFILSSVTITMFVVMTSNMVDTTNDESMLQEFVSENEDISRSPGIAMWNVLFFAEVALSHYITVCLVCTPCSWELGVLIFLMIVVPILLIIMPQSKTYRDSYTMHFSQGNDEPRPPLFCGIPKHVLYLVAMVGGLYMMINNIPFDPTTYKFQLAFSVAVVDTMVLAVGHMWDMPPTVSTVVNTRTIYTIWVIIVNIFVYLSYENMFSTKYTEHLLL